MTCYRSPDAESSAGEPSYAGLAARLKKLPSADNPNAQALLSKLERGEIDSEECLYELTQDAIRRTQDQQQQARQRAEHDTQQQQQLQLQRQQVDSEMDKNAYSEEPTIISADSSETPKATDEAASDTQGPAPATAPNSGGGGGLAQTPGAPTQVAMDKGDSSSAAEYSAGFIPFQEDHGLGEDDERDDHFED